MLRNKSELLQNCPFSLIGYDLQMRTPTNYEENLTNNFQMARTILWTIFASRKYCQIRNAAGTGRHQRF